MSSTKLIIPPEFEAAPKADRIEFVQNLWDQIARDPDTIPVPEHHKRILDERLSELERNEQAGRPWSEVRDELLATLRRN
tara:strand:- start:239 stop:478 length:240 start_codon:yes stop_codon:yes gene_type:complete